MNSFQGANRLHPHGVVQSSLHDAAHELRSRSRQVETSQTLSGELRSRHLADTLLPSAQARLEAHMTRTSAKMARSVILLVTIGLASRPARAQDVADDGRVGIVLAHPIFDALS